MIAPRAAVDAIRVIADTHPGETIMCALAVIADKLVDDSNTINELTTDLANVAANFKGLN